MLARRSAGRSSLVFGASLGAIFLSACAPLGPGVPSHEQVAYRWAPIHVQELEGRGHTPDAGIADLLTAIDYDGNWSALDNWDNLDTNFSAVPVAYYSVVETDTHWFVVYAFYHPRDWCNTRFCSEHENDMEGVLAAVRKSDADPLGELDGIITLNHEETPAFTSTDLEWRTHESTLRYVTAQEALGHGMLPWPLIEGGENAVVYCPMDGRGALPEPRILDRRDEEEMASGGTDEALPAGTRLCRDAPDPGRSYQLVDIFAPGGLWSRRGDSETFAEWGVFAGDRGGGCGHGLTVRCVENAANPPWGWTHGSPEVDAHDLPATAQLALDPAPIAAALFGFSGPYGFDYTNNAFLIDR